MSTLDLRCKIKVVCSVWETISVLLFRLDENKVPCAFTSLKACGMKIVVSLFVLVFTLCHLPEGRSVGMGVCSIPDYAVFPSDDPGMINVLESSLCCFTHTFQGEQLPSCHTTLCVEPVNVTASYSFILYDAESYIFLTYFEELDLKLILVHNWFLDETLLIHSVLVYQNSMLFLVWCGWLPDAIIFTCRNPVRKTN